MLLILNYFAQIIYQTFYFDIFALLLLILFHISPAATSCYLFLFRLASHRQLTLRCAAHSIAFPIKQLGVRQGRRCRQEVENLFIYFSISRTVRILHKEAQLE